MELSVIIKEARFVDMHQKEDLCKAIGESLLVYALVGEALISLKDRQLDLPEGQMYLSSEEKELRISGEGRLILLSFSHSFPTDGIFDRVIRPTDRQRRQLGEILREIAGERGEPMRFGAKKILENSLSTLLLLLVRGEETCISEELIFLSEEVRSHSQAVRHYLLENFTSRITLDSLCYIFRTNKTALCKEFREEYGKTVLGYLNELRISEAKRLLRDGNLSVTDVSDRLGFESIHYFSRLFKKLCGISPTEYSRQEKKKRKLMEEI